MVLAGGFVSTDCVTTSASATMKYYMCKNSKHYKNNFISVFAYLPMETITIG